MRFHRGRLRVIAITCLVFQVAWLTALVPRDCCAAHRPADRSERSCHQPVPKVQCPMRSADGTPCPMHGGKTECSLRGSCSGPMASLLALLTNHGILPEPTAAPTDMAA